MLTNERSIYFNLKKMMTGFLPLLFIQKININKCSLKSYWKYLYKIRYYK